MGALHCSCERRATKDDRRPPVADRRSTIADLRLATGDRWLVARLLGVSECWNVVSSAAVLSRNLQNPPSK